ncbi:TPA: glycosyltransferase [Photobacterium damselae]
MKLLFLVNDVLYPDTGIGKKIISQANALKSIAEDFYFVYTDESFNYRNINGVPVSEKGSIFNKYIFRYRFDSLFEFILSEGINVIYIRYTHFSSSGFIAFVKKLKRIDVQIIIEIPTYPYDSEYEQLGITSKCKLFIDRIYRNKLRHYVDKCITFTSVNQPIFGIETLQISNAVSNESVVKNISALNQRENIELNVINLICVASLHSWHGYDRLISSLPHYLSENDSKKIHIYIVGDGPELNKLKKLVEKNSLQENVTFCGELFGLDLQEKLLHASIGVDSLGRHRSGNLSNNSLKSKEYLSYGLPVVKSHHDGSIDDLNCVLNVSADENEINIKDIISWYLDNKFSSKKQDIAKLCLNYYTWDIQMEKVFESVKC